MLGFEVYRNGEKLALAGVQESGVMSVILSWVGKGKGASVRAAAGEGPIPDLHLHVAGMDTSDPRAEDHIDWIDLEDLKVQEEIRIRLVCAEVIDAPLRRRPVEPPTQHEDGRRLMKCSFCRQNRQIEPARFL